MFRLQRVLALITLIFSLNLAYAEDKKITIDRISTKVQALSRSKSQKIDALRKRTQAPRDLKDDLKGYIKALDELIVRHEDEVKALEKGGTIYELTLEAQSGSRKLIETMEADLSSGTNNAGQVKEIENLIKSQKKVLIRYNELITEMREKAERIKSKLEDIKADRKIIGYLLAANQDIVALKRLMQLRIKLDATTK